MGDGRRPGSRRTKFERYAKKLVADEERTVT
jgi:hypothetical protein